ncbi:MAG: hypothetical protein RIM33_11530 [Alphaproteobacteria bacterium]
METDEFTIETLASFPWNTLLATLIGGGITLLGVMLANRYQILQENARTQSQNNALLKAVFSEFEALWEGYHQDLGRRLEALSGEGEILERFYPFYGRYFVVYESNAAQIGHLESDRVRDALIRLSIAGKGIN